MSKPELTITDLLIALPGKEEEVLQKLLAVTEGERRVGPDFGMTRFDLHRDRSNPSQFLLYENWTTKTGFEEYHRAHRPPELSSFLEEAKDLLTEAPEEVSHQWEMVSSPDENAAAIAAKRFLDALTESDTGAISRMWTDDAVLEFPFAPEGFPTRIESQAAIDPYFRDALSVVNPIDYPNRVITPLTDPNACIIEFGSKLTIGEDPTVHENSYITIVRTREGKIAHFKEHYDSLKRAAGFPSSAEMAQSPASRVPYVVKVSLRAREGESVALAGRMKEIAQRASRDLGCQFYRVFQSRSDACAFSIFEAWNREVDFKTHMAADWVSEANKTIAPYLDGEISSDSLTEL
ncbi:MAG: antibiotic biosynthesis monooxygenase [Verrucomicrobiota bacterium]